MPTTHICNTYFDHELQEEHPPAKWGQHPIYGQLQFLPFLYGEPTDSVLVTQLPDPTFLANLSSLYPHHPQPRLYTETLPAHTTLSSWGASPSIEAFAKSGDLDYSIPDIGVVKKIDSKAFAFPHSTIPNKAFLFNTEQIIQWAKTQKGPLVIKTCFGVSGRGHLFLDADHLDRNAIHHFLQKEWRAKRGVIAEPWVERELDFSTQWHLSQSGNIELLASVLCSSSDKGQYHANIASSDTVSLFGRFYPLLQDHIDYVRPLLHTIQKEGFFGNLGIDAMIYTLNGKRCLQPIGEINGRKTMGWVCAQVQKRFFPSDTIQLSFDRLEHNTPSLLPTSLGKIVFRRGLFVHKKIA